MKINELVPLAGPDDLVITAWDVFSDNGYEAAVKAGVLSLQDLETVKDALSEVVPMKGAFDKTYIKNLTPNHIKSGTRPRAGGAASGRHSHIQKECGSRSSRLGSLH